MRFIIPLFSFILISLALIFAILIPAKKRHERTLGDAHILNSK